MIFSAGIGNVIVELLIHKRLLLDNVRIVSNFMNFNQDVWHYYYYQFDYYYFSLTQGILTGFQDQIIHSFNKSGQSIIDNNVHEKPASKRKNVILLGDSIGDPSMSEGISHDNDVLKIGFLNSNVGLII